MTVKHLQNLQRQQNAISQMSDPNVMNKFKAGFTECANEVGRFPGIEPIVKRRLLQHLNNCINGVKPSETIHSNPHHPPSSTVQVQILPSPPSSPQQEPVMVQPSQITATANGYFLTNGNGTGVQLIPTKLANGSVAFVLPQTLQPPPPPPVPMLVPIPTRTASTGSATSNTSLYDRMPRENSTSPYHTPPSPANSYDAMDCTPPSHHHQHYHQQQQSYSYQQTTQRSCSPGPLSLVMRKTDYDDIRDDDKPWRPW